MIRLPEVEFAREHFVQCHVHPGPDRAAYGVCQCVLRGAPVEVHKEPTPKRFGIATCAFCYAHPEATQLITACPKCVEYHLLSRVEPLIFVQDPDLSDLLLAERDGYISFRQRIHEGHVTPPFNHFKGLLAWAFDLGVRCAVWEFNHRDVQPKAMGAVA